MQKAFGTYVKIDPSQNQDLSTSLERPYKELLNACFSFETCHSFLKLWGVKERPQNSKNPLQHGYLESCYKELLVYLLSVSERGPR